MLNKTEKSTHWITIKDAKIMGELIANAGEANENKMIRIEHRSLGDGRIMKSIILQSNGFEYSKSYTFSMVDIVENNDIL